MQVTQLWKKEIAWPEGQTDLTNQVWQVCLSQDNQTVLAAVGDLILVFDVATEQMARQPIRSLHKKQIHCLVTNQNGTKFATASKDKLVVIWQNNFTPEIKYSHSASVQCLCFNPVTNQLFSGATSEFIVFTQGNSSPEKFSCDSKILCCDYSPDGQVLAMGQVDGKLTFRNKGMEVIETQQLGNTTMIWCMKWSPISPEHSNNVLAIGTWKKKVSFYSGQGKLLGDKFLDNEPMALRWMPSGEFLLVSESDYKVKMYTRDLHLIQVISESKEYIWDMQLKGTKSNGDELLMVQGGNAGGVRVLKMKSNLVNAFFKDKYVSRVDITDILIQQLDQDRQIRVKCRELVKHISIYKNLLAVHLQKQVIIYQQSSQELKYKLFKKFTKTLECESIILGTQTLLYCQGNKLIMLNFQGHVEREWVFNTEITMAQLTGGALRREHLLVGLTNGQVHRVVIDNPFSVVLVEHNVSIRSMATNKSQSMLALIDANNNLTVWHLLQKKQVFTEMNVDSVAFNLDFEHLICYSGQGMLFVKCADFAPTFQKFRGSVLGFKGNQLFLLDATQKLVTVDVPQTSNLLKYIEAKQFETAYELACMGVTEQDFHLLGVQALSHAYFDIAKKCFLKIQDLNYLDLTNKYEQEYKQGQLQLHYLQAQLQAYQKNFSKAGQILTENNMTDKAVELFTELKRWDDAKKFVVMSDQQTEQSLQNTPQTKGKGSLASMASIYGKIKKGAKSAKMTVLVRNQSNYLLQIGYWQQGCEQLLSIKDYKRVIEIYAEKKALESLIEVCRQLDKSDNADLIKQCAACFRKQQHHGYAKEAYLKLGDNKSLMELHIQLEKWEEAFILAKQNESFMDMLRLPYAEYLCKNDRFEDALKVYRKINRPDISQKILSQMARNAVDEFRFLQASHFHWNLALECLSKNDQPAFHHHSMVSEVYYAFNMVHQFLETPFCSINGQVQAAQVFYASRFLANMLNKPQVESLPGLNKVYIFYALAKVSNQVEAFKTSRLCYEKLQKLSVPSKLNEEMEVEHLLIKSKPFSDAQNLFSVCNRCLNANQILQTSSVHPTQYTCLTCQHPFVHSFSSFQHLALVEFQVDPSLSHPQVLQLINSQEEGGKDTQVKQQLQNDGWDQNSNQPLHQTVDQQNNSLFFQKMNETCEIQLAQKDYLPMMLNERQLKSLEQCEVFWVDLTSYNPDYKIRYYKNMQPEVMVDNCRECGRFFLLEEYELEFLIRKKCPFCSFGDKKNKSNDEII